MWVLASKKSRVSSFLSPLARTTVGRSHVNQELDGVVDIAVASAQSTHGLILREAHGRDAVDIRLRGPRIGVYTRAVRSRALRHPRNWLRGGGGGDRGHRGRRRIRGSISGGGNCKATGRGRARHNWWCAEGAGSYAGAVTHVGAWRRDGGRGFELSMEVIRTRLGRLL